jgi:hypothetical protein
MTRGRPALITHRVAESTSRLALTPGQKDMAAGFGPELAESYCLP